MSRRLRLAALAALACLVLAAPAWGPLLLRRLSWFEVRRVEISGTRLLAPHEVLLATGIRPGQNVWEDAAQWERALRAHPAVAGARVTRKLPGTLRVRVAEKRPVAFVEADGLAPVSAAGERLPLDPTRTRMDLPVIRGGRGEVSAATRLTLLAETDRLGRLAPGLLAEISEVRAADAAARVLVLRHSRAEIVIPVGVEPIRLTQLRAVLADLERRLPAADPAAPPAAPRVDLRFGEQIVVRLPSSV